MKKIIALLMALILTMSMFVGCAAGDSNPTTEGTEATTETATTTELVQPENAEASAVPDVSEPADGYDVFDVFTYPGVEEITGLSYREASRYLVDNGFTESWLGHWTVHDSIRIGTMGDVIVGQFRLTQHPEFLLNFRVEKSDKLQNTTGLEPTSDDTVILDESKTQELGNEGAKCQVRRWQVGTTEGMYKSFTNENGHTIYEYPVYYVSSYYYPKTENLYTVFAGTTMFANGTTWSTKGDFPDFMNLGLFSNASKWNECFDCLGADSHGDYMKQEWNDVVMDTFTVKIDGEKVTYRYRYGSSLDEWVHSEYNTDGWHRIFYRPGNENEGNGMAVSAKYGYKFCLGAETDENDGSDLIVNPMALRDESKMAAVYNTPEDTNYNPDEFERGSFYVAKNVPMHIYGFNMFNNYQSWLYEGGDGPIYRYSGWYVDYKMNTPLTIDGIGLREEDTEHMKFMLVPHYVPNSDSPLTYEKASGYPYGNDMEAIREAATELEVEFKPASELPKFWSPYIYQIIPDYGFRLVLNAKDIEGFEPGVAYDICITYDDEVVYWLFMPEFTQW